MSSTPIFFVGDQVVFAAKVFAPPYTPYYNAYMGHVFEVVGFMPNDEGPGFIYDHVELKCVPPHDWVNVMGYVHDDEIICVASPTHVVDGNLTTSTTSVGSLDSDDVLTVAIIVADGAPTAAESVITTFISGGGGDFLGAGASDSWAEPAAAGVMDAVGDTISSVVDSLSDIDFGIGGIFD